MMGFERDTVTLCGKREPDIFLSHNSADKDFVRRLAVDLNYFGLDGWLDEWELEVGDSLHASLANALEKCKYVAVVISKSFNESQWCCDELHQALTREKRIKEKVVLPLLVDNVTPPGFIEDRLYLDFGNNYFNSLVRLCSILLNISAKSTSQVLAVAPPKNITEVSNILESLGWNKVSIVDLDKLHELVSAIRRLRFIDESLDNHIISLDDNNIEFKVTLVDMLQGKISEELLDLFTPFASLQQNQDLSLLL